MLRPKNVVSACGKLFGTSSPFLRMFLRMCLLVAALALAEAVALWLIGAQYAPDGAVREIHVYDLSFSADGRWGAARVRIERAGIGRPREFAVVLHDMQRLERSLPLKLSSYELTSVAISPRGDCVAFATLDRKVHIVGRDHRGGRAKQTFHQSEDAAISHVVWSPDARRLVGVGYQFIHVWDVRSGELLHRLRHGSHSLLSLSFSPDAGTLLSLGDDAKFRFWEMSSGELHKITPVPTAVTSAVFSADGRFAAIATGREVSVWSTHRGEELWRKGGSAWRYAALALSPDAELLACVQRTAVGEAKPGNRIAIVRARTGESVGVLKPAQAQIEGVHFAPDGTLCSWGSEGEIVGWNIRTRKTTWRYSYLSTLAIH